MTRSRFLATSAGVCLVLLLASCGGSDGNDQESEAGEHNENSEGEGDEESGTQYSKQDAYDETRGGARLLLAYDADQDSFTGTIENTTEDTLDQARIEVHLSNGVELGPTTPRDIPPGETLDVELPAEGEDFTTWSAHPEVGRDEHGTEGNEDEEHSESDETDEHQGDGD